ncbi:uncharacterized protein BHQ10_001584 [Talaromyces amestolkiae]|uniref:Uncharacterized protein n=1 Tax=Talaromyces amestolkiae TaxID=1196081 RepID=A0A364KPU2_TALAM|nr:uncharacterized protein BHQ10_001584 [Talaromyces amestolkiae]RAO65572.1 hypothetical protein BHQ10_001584 [Talaromyces amestolkiae]
MGSVFIRPHGAPRLRRAVCQFCERTKRTEAVSYSTLQRAPLRNALQHPTRHASNTPLRQDYVHLLASDSSIVKPLQIPRRLLSSTPDITTSLAEIKEKSEALRRSDTAAPEEAVIALLQQCLHHVESFLKVQELHETENSNPAPKVTATKSTAASSLLGLDEKQATPGKLRIPKVESRVVDSISQISTELLVDEKVFISPEVLELYTKIHVLLKRADYLPQIFSLYANKPIPEANTSPIKFRQQNPNSLKNAISSKLANEALEIALEQKNLSLALAIIDTTFCAPAFTRAKLLKNAAVPLAGLATAPLASYVVATWAANMQNTMDESLATGITFTATLAYIGFTSSVGIIAVATSNDQMERVSWAPGIPLRHRWLREEERGALDRVAMAWGFRDPYRRGEEEGEEWESLREFIGMRGMILDRTELMEGMQ